MHVVIVTNVGHALHMWHYWHMLHLLNSRLVSDWIKVI